MLQDCCSLLFRKIKEEREREKERKNLIFNKGRIIIQFANTTHTHIYAKKEK